MIRHCAGWAMLLALAAPVQAQADRASAEPALARYTLAADPGLLFDTADPETGAVLQAALGGDHGNLNDLWAQVLTGAVQIRRDVAPGLTEVLWYSSLFDSGIASRWAQQGGGAWRAVAATPISGEALRGEPTLAESVRWPTQGSLKAAIEQRARQTVLAAEAGGWFDRDHRDSGTAALIRAMHSRASLRAMLASPGYGRTVAQSVTLLAGGGEGLAPEVRGGLALLGSAGRMTLRPIAAFRRVDGWTLALQSPDAPRWTWLVHAMDPSAVEEEAAISAVQLVNSGGAA